MQLQQGKSVFPMMIWLENFKVATSTEVSNWKNNSYYGVNPTTHVTTSQSVPICKGLFVTY
uniref:Uncharacterized protein n=1 Tax=Setaria italica TaxID=4555 RepID=K3ZYW2_SETIT